MKIEQILSWLGLAGGIIGILTFVGGILAWYSGAIEKRYAAQRDFQHLKKNQENISLGIHSLFKEVDRRFDDLVREVGELKALNNNLIHTINNESISSIIRRKEKD